MVCLFVFYRFNSIIFLCVCTVWPSNFKFFLPLLHLQVERIFFHCNANSFSRLVINVAWTQLYLKCWVSWVDFVLTGFYYQFVTLQQVATLSPILVHGKSALDCSWDMNTKVIPFGYFKRHSSRWGFRRISLPAVWLISTIIVMFYRWSKSSFGKVLFGSNSPSTSLDSQMPLWQQSGKWSSVA